MTTTIVESAGALAGHGRRLSAALLDAVTYVVVVGACGTAGFFIGLAIGAAAGADESAYDGWEELGWIFLGSILGVLVGVVAAIALAVVLVRRSGARNGQTLGKQMVGIRAVRADRAEIELGLALLRELVAKWLLIWIAAALISAAFGFADVGTIGLLLAIAIWYVPALLDDERRALHDRICSTRVVPAAVQPAPPAADDLWPAS